MQGQVAYDFRGKSAVVTGGASGFGRAMAEKLGAAGAQVLIVDIDGDGATETAKTLPDGLGRAAAADVSSEADVAAFVRTATEAFGSIDMFFNNVGIMGGSPLFLESTEAQFDLLFDVNVKGVFFGLRDVGRQMVAQGGGVIVNTASSAGLRGRGGPLYSATKAAVISLTKTTAHALGPLGVRVNAVAPTATITHFFGHLGQTEEELAPLLDPQVAQIPLGRLGTPGDVSDAVAWLFSDAAAFVNGAVLSVDGGFTV